MTILGGQLGPGKGSDGLQVAPRGDVVLLGSRLDLEKLLSRQAVDRGPCARRHPSSPGCWTVMTHRDCRPTVCLLESAIQGPHRWTMIPLSSSERAMGVVLGKGFPGVLGKHSARSALVEVLPTLPKSPMFSPFSMLWTFP